MIGGNSVHRGLPRGWGVLATVVLGHLGVLWWLQDELSREALPLITPVTLISVPPDPPAPAVLPKPIPGQPAPPAKIAATQTAPPPRPLAPPEQPAQPVPVPAGVHATPPSATSVPVAVAPTAESAAQAVMGTAAVSPTSAYRAGPSGPASGSPSVVLPSANAAYLHNPPPAYPAMSRRLAEQGRVMVRVLIGSDGLPQKAELQAGSGYDRLDRAALDAVMRWRFVPGRRGDVPETMWVSVPIVFNLE